MKKNLSRAAFPISLVVLLLALLLSAPVAYALTVSVPTAAQTTITYTYPLTLSYSAAQIPSSYNIIDPFDGAKNISFVNFNVKSEGSDSRITSVSAALTASGTSPTTLYLYAGTTLVGSKSVSISGSSAGSAIVFSGLNYIVPTNTAQMFTIKGDFPSNTKSGTTAYVSVSGVTYQQALYGRTITAANTVVVGATQNFFEAAPQFAFVSQSATSMQDQYGYTTVMTATFSMNVIALGGDMIKPANSDFKVKYGYISSSNIYTAFDVPSVNVITIPNNNIAQGSTASVTVTASVLASSIPASGMYNFFIDSIAYNAGGRAGGQTAGLESFRTGTVNAVVAGGATCSSSVLNRNLTIGSSGDDVTVLQNFLKSKGFALFDYTGYFGAQTASALAGYQAAKGISPVDGYFGPVTRASVIADCTGTGTPLPVTPITVISPNGGETYQLGKNVPFSWKWASPEYPGNPVMYWFSSTQAEPVYGEGITYVPGASTQTGIIPYNAGVNLQPGSYKIAVCDGYLSSIGSTIPASNCDYSDNYFTMTAASPIDYSITVLSPNTQEILKEGDTYTVRWSSQNVPSTATVSIALFRSDGQNATIAQNIPVTQGSYQWQVSSAGNWGFGFLDKLMKLAEWLGFNIARADGYSYKLAVSSYWITTDGGGSTGDDSDQSFTITPASTAPTASLTANGSSDLTIPINQKVGYEWKSTNAIKAASTYTTNLTRCGRGGAWLANTINGSIAPALAAPKYVGCVYTVTYTATNSAGASGSSILKIRYVPKTTPTISSISPTSVPAGATTTMTITGTGFTSDSVVNLGYTASTIFLRGNATNNGTTLSVSIPPLPATGVMTGNTATLLVANSEDMTSPRSNAKTFTVISATSSVATSTVATSTITAPIAVSVTPSASQNKASIGSIFSRILRFFGW